MDYVTWQFVYFYLLPIIFGGYGFTWLMFRLVRRDIREIKVNEIAHLSDRVTKLEDTDGSS